MAKTVLDIIRDTVRGGFELNVPMAQKTTMQVGGSADLVVHPSDRDDLVALVRILHDREVPWLSLGNGSNLVVRDAGIRGAVISLIEGICVLEGRGEVDGHPRVYVEAGVGLRRLVRWTVDHAATGLEPLVGIPGTVGGAVAMNAGAWDFEMADRIVEAELMSPDGEIRVVPREDLHFGYRTFELEPKHLILSVLLRLDASDRETVKLRAKKFYRARRDRQPVTEQSAGSVFKNPPVGPTAGQLIDACGLKGIRVGGAEISRQHANFIVNNGAATASHVVSLIGMVQERVYVKHKVKLETEVQIVGDWEKGKFRIRE